MAIVFTDFNSVEVDGVAAGDIVSVLANYPTRKNVTLNAFKDFRKSEKDDKVAKIAAADAKATAAETKAVTDLAAKDAERLADLSDKDTAHAAVIAELNEIKTALGGEEVVKAKLRDERRARILIEKAEAEAKRLALEAEEAAL